jgi:transposase
MAKRATAERRPASEQPPLDSQDVSAIRSFIEGMIAAGAIATLVHWLLGFLTTLWKTQNDLLERLRSRKRRKGENEALRRLQLTLPGLDWSAANDNGPPKKKLDPKDDKRKRGNNENRDEHGRGTYPAHLKRVPEYFRVPEDQRACKRCGVEMTLKEWLLREVLEKIPAIHFVRALFRERLQCPCCQRESVAAAPVDTVKDNGSLGTNLVTEAFVDHIGDGVPLERIARNARATGVPLVCRWLQIHWRATSTRSSICSIP